LIAECLQTEPSKRITFNAIISHLLPRMSLEFHSLSYYCTSHCPTCRPAGESTASTITSSSVCLKNSVDGDSVALAVPSDPSQRSAGSQPLAVAADDSADSDADDNDGGVYEKSECSSQTSGGGSQKQQQRPSPFYDAMDTHSITVSSGLAYCRLPAAC